MRTVYIAGFVLACMALLSACEGGTIRNDKTKMTEAVNKTPLPPFEFMNQDSQLVSQRTVQGKIHVMDFFFTSCPTICPKMKANMLTVYEQYEKEDRLLLVSHSIDTRHDSVPVLKEYSERLEVSAPRWNFVTGEKEDILGMAKSYMVAAMEDTTAPGGYAHSGAMILLDAERNIRGYYDGTSESETKILIQDIAILLDE